MRIAFEVGGQPAEFHRSALTGRTYVVVDGEEHELAKSTDLSTHFSYDTARTWTVSHAGHEIEIDWQRTQFMGGLRPQDFAIRVDGEDVAREHGF